MGIFVPLIIVQVTAGASPRPTVSIRRRRRHHNCQLSTVNCPQKKHALGVLLFQSLFQCGRGQGGEADTAEAVFAGEDEGFGQIVAGDNLTLLFRPLQKFPGPLGGGGIVQIENANNGPIPDRHIIADG